MKSKMKYILAILLIIVPALCPAQSRARRTKKSAKARVTAKYKKPRKSAEPKDPFSEFAFVGSFTNGIAIVGKDFVADSDSTRRFGLIDENVKVRIPVIFDDLTLLMEGEDDGVNAYLCRRDGQYGIVSSDSTMLLPCVYDELSRISYRQWTARQSNKIGIVEMESASNARLIIPCIYDKLTRKDDFYYASANKKDGVLDSDGNIVVPVEYDDVSEFYDDSIAVVTNGTLHGFYDVDGKMLQPCDLKEIYLENGNGGKVSLDFSQILTTQGKDIYAVREGGVGVIDGTTLKTIIPSTYEYISPFVNGKALFMYKGKWGLMTTQNVIIQQPVYDEVKANGAVAIPYNIPTDVLNGRTYVRIGSKWGMLNKNGATLVVEKYDSLGVYHNKLMVAKLDGRYGYISTNGKEAIHLQYVWAGDFSDGLAAVMDAEGKYSFINAYGEVVIKPRKYDRVGQFTGGQCRVWRKDKTWLIDKKGDKVKEK